MQLSTSCRPDLYSAHELRKLMAGTHYSRIVKPSRDFKRHKPRINLTSEFRCLRSFEEFCDLKLRK